MAAMPLSLSDLSTLPRSRHVRVGVMVNNMGGYSRGVLRGVASFAMARGWECKVEGVNVSGALDSPAEFDGWIVQALSADIAADLHYAGVPVVNVSSALTDADLPSVVSDDVAVGRSGADYLFRKGFRNFAFFSPLDRQFARLRFEGFRQRLAESGLQPALLKSELDLETEMYRLPRPLAIMAANDSSALPVLDRCRQHKLKVPDEVAILGVDNDDLVQSLCSPPLSSINMATDRIGFEAAGLLQRLLSGEAVSNQRTLIPPTGVITRQSTDIVATNDPAIAEAVRFIRDRASTPIGVDDVSTSVTISRRQLERRFRAALGHSVFDEIKRCRIDRARQLLSETELTIPQIATASGFSSASYFTVVFGESTGTTPASFRKQMRRT